MLRRAWRVRRDRATLMAPLWRHSPDRVFDHRLLYPELKSVLRAGGPELEPYQGMAEFWDDYASARLPDYPSFLTALARRRGVELRSVLEIACGTGVLTVRLGRVAADVVGLDASEPMLAVARQRHGAVPGLAFTRGDFRDFALGRQFDAVVCASNSLNYVADRDELTQVFVAVREHLRPGGLFVFDTFSEFGMRRLSGLYYHVTVAGRRIALHFSYDNDRRKETSRAVLPSGLETHRRIPLDPSDVETAAGDAGLSVDDYFFNSWLPSGWCHGFFHFFVLTKRG